MTPIDRRTLGRTLTRLANASVEEVLALADSSDDIPVEPAQRIGMTGPPGAGKSSLGGRLAVLRARRRRIGVLAIDPDGLAQSIPELLHAMDRAGFEEVSLETVGVGQAEHAARHQVDTMVLVLIPGAGASCRR